MCSSDLQRIANVADLAAANRFALLHGDLQPGNFLVGPRGPVLVDADQAGQGDPALELATCLAHLLILAAARPHWRDRYLTCFDAFQAAYLQRVTWERPEYTDERAARLLPAVLLGSLALGGQDLVPCSSSGTGSGSELLVAFARRLLFEPVLRLSAVRESWRQA